MDVEKYVRDKIAVSNPKLHLVSYAQSTNGHVFVIAKDNYRVESAVLPVTNLEKDGSETAVKQVIDARLKRLSDHLYPSEAPRNVKGNG
jgi:hypothetical protein